MKSMEVYDINYLHLINAHHEVIIMLKIYIYMHYIECLINAHHIAFDEEAVKKSRPILAL